MFVKNLIRLAASVFFVGVATIGAPGCGDDSGDDAAEENVQSLCREVADTQCEKIYSCLSDSDLEELELPSTVASCKQQLRAARGCDAATGNDMCDGSEVFNAENAAKCVSQYQAASCNQLGSTSQSNFAPACDEMCVVE